MKNLEKLGTIHSNVRSHKSLLKRRIRNVDCRDEKHSNHFICVIVNILNAVQPLAER
jgi:hypothetical protein